MDFSKEADWELVSTVTTMSFLPAHTDIIYFQRHSECDNPEGMHNPLAGAGSLQRQYVKRDRGCDAMSTARNVVL